MKRLLSTSILTLVAFSIIFGCSPEEDDTNPPPSVLATLEPEPQAKTQYTLTVTAGEGGTVSTEGGTFDEGTEVTILATPNEGYEFVGWNGIDSENDSVVITLSSNTTIEALFSVLPQQYTLTVSHNDGGEVNTSGGTFNEGTRIELFASPSEGFEFVRWIGFNSTEEIISIELNSNMTIEALFAEISIIPSLADNLNFENLNTRINLECSFILGYNDYRFYVDHNQPFINSKNIVFRLNHHDLNGWIDNNNYLIFWFNNSNGLESIQVYKNQSLIETFTFNNSYVIEQLNSLTTFFDNDSFFSQTQFNSEIESTIEDGIYLHSEFSKQINYTENEDRFKCVPYNKSNFYNHLNEKGKEYFKVVNGQIVGRSLIYNSDLANTYKVWSLSDWYFTDVYTNESREILRIEHTEIDDFSANNLNLTNPIKLYINDEILGIKEEKLLTKVDNEDIGITMIDSFEGVGFYLDEVYSQIDFDDPISYIEAFIQDASRHGVDLSYVNPNDFQFTIIPDNEWTSSAAAYASSSCDNNRVNVTFKESIWVNGKTPYKTSIPDAVKIMWHELGHDILNLDHVCLGDHIMSGRHQEPKIVYTNADCSEEYITVYGMDWDNQDIRKNFQRAVDDMFSGFEQIYFNCTSGKRERVY